MENLPSGVKKIVPLPLPGPARRPLTYVPLRENPTKETKQETLKQRAKLTDWLLERMSPRVPSLEEEQESTRVRTARLRRDVRRFHKPHDDHSSSEDPLVKIYLEGRK